MNRAGFRVAARVREWCISEHDRRWAATRRHNKCLNTETANKVPNPFPVRTGIEVTLVPGEAKGLIGELDHKKIEPCTCWKPAYFHVHELDRPQRVNSNPPARAGMHPGPAATAALDRTMGKVMLSAAPDVAVTARIEPMAPIATVSDGVPGIVRG